MILTYSLPRVLRLMSNAALPQHFANPLFTSKHYKSLVDFFLSTKRLEAKIATPGRYDWTYYDRSGTIVGPLNVHLEDQLRLPIYNAEYKNKEYLELCLRRVDQILSFQKQTNILWSGGLDSTTMLFAFLNRCKNLDQLSIVCTFESVLESGSMFDRYIKNSGVRIKFDHTRLNRLHSFTYDNEDTQQLYISGCCGDQLFGISSTGKRSFAIPGADIMGSWKNLYDSQFIDFLEPTFAKSFRPIETVRDLIWWLHFNFFWNTTYYDEKRGRPADLANRIVSFYGTQEFQQWAAVTDSYYEQTDSYRWPAKHALSQLVDVDYYIQNKKKSMSFTWIQHSNWDMMDVNFKNYYSE